jgi:subtilisin family serine protease
MIFKRTPVALALAGALFSVGAGAAVSPFKPHAIHVQPQNVTLGKINPLIGADGKAAVIIKLKGEPATLTYARALRQSGNGPLGMTSANNAARAAISNLKTIQTTFVGQLKSAGVAYTEIYRVQRVLNAVAVRMKPADMQKVRALPNVEAVEFLTTYQRPANIASVPFVGAPKVWDGYNQLGLPFNATGQGIKVGDIDTGLDYIHPDFGGSGTTAAYQDVDPTSVIGQNSHNIIFPTAKVAGGYDFAGDAYDSSNAPQPDANPMDCGGHGTHTAGTIAGIGVNSDGTPFGGPWNTTAPYAANLKVGPGVAPGATLYALRVFGCGGSTNLVTQAIDWATDPNGNGDLSDHLDVINMSLGSPFGVDIGTGWNSDIEAVNNAAAAGLISVSAAGNSGDTFFIAGAPGAASVGLMVAASVDDGQTVPYVHESSPNVADYQGQASAFTNPSGIAPPAPGGQSANIVYAVDSAAAGGLHKGCGVGGASNTLDPGAFANAAALSGNIALIDRGTCSFWVKVLNAQLAGAAAVIVDNNANTGFVTMGNTGTTLPQDITIPSVFITQASGTTLKVDLAGTVAGGFNAVLQPQLADTLASFSSRGPVAGANGVIELKPDLAGPGLNIPSAQTGFTCSSASQGCITPAATGIIPGGQALTISGTSMATPHVAGMVALLRQLNPTMTIEQIKALAINAAAHDVFSGASSTPPRYGASRVGAGRMDVAASATTTLQAYNADVPDAINVTFDIEPVGAGFSTSHKVTLSNLAATDASVTLAVDDIVATPGVSYSVPSGTIVVPAGGSSNISVTLNADTSAMKFALDPTMTTAQHSTFFNSNFPRQFLSENSSVLRVLDSTTSVELARLPLYAASRPHSTMATASDLGASASTSGTTNLALSGSDVCSGTLDASPHCTLASSADEESLVSPFELQVTSVQDSRLPGWANLHYVGVNTAPDVDASSNPTVDYFFGVATYGNWATPNYVSVNVCVDSDNDGLFDKIVANTSAGTLDALVYGPGFYGNDALIDLVYDNVTGNAGFDFLGNLAPATALDTGALSNNTMIMGVQAASLGIATPGTTPIHYGVAICPGYNPLCGSEDWTFGGQGTANCGISGSGALQAFKGPYTYDPANPGVDGNGNLFLEDLNGGAVSVAYDVNKVAANGSTGMLLLHTHNTAVTSAQVVALDRIFADGFGQ